VVGRSPAKAGDLGLEGVRVEATLQAQPLDDGLDLQLDEPAVRFVDELPGRRPGAANADGKGKAGAVEQELRGVGDAPERARALVEPEVAPDLP
jgi:hypothetical protein